MKTTAEQSKTTSGGKKQNWKAPVGVFLAFSVFVAVSYLAKFAPGMEMGKNSGSFLYSMLVLFPGAFILIGLFEVWVDKKIVEKHLGNQAGLLGYLWVFLLACTVMAPLIIALPVAAALYKKGARLQLVLGYISASTICRIPMTIFEATYLGLPFSVVRLLVSIPLVILFSELLGLLFKHKPLPKT